MVDISDVIGLLSDEQPSRQVDPTVKNLAIAASQARDEAAEAGAKARVLKDKLEAALREAGLEGLELPDRTIRFKTANSKQKTLKALKKILGDDAGKDLWGKLPTTPRTSLDIPAPEAPEPDPE